MNWLDEPGIERRPLVFVEDHLYHTTDLLSVVQHVRPDLLGQITVAVLDRPGPDTGAAAAACASRFPDVIVAAPMPPDLANVASFSRWVSRQLRPGGVLVQDVQLGTLPFIPTDRWWESIYLAATVRGMFPDRPPAVRFLSNKRGYSATFGSEMLEAGFDPRDVMDKGALNDIVVPSLAALFDRLFPLKLGNRPISLPDRPEIEDAFDLVLWPQQHAVELGGRAVAEPGKFTLKTGSPEAETWTALVKDLLSGGDGLAVVDVGARLAPPDADRAELTNIAARHIHTLRSRLRNSSDIVTARHAYRLNDQLRAGLVQPRRTFATSAPRTKVAE
ncbi:MAG TPA: hypothetical protein VN700_07000 [Vicinamibacterales bacterium]|nr:hypothetical protein [Vicinamibacterales bacterium]